MHNLYSTPLDTLPIVSVDLETTGLNTKTDRIIQIGMTNPHDTKNEYDQLIQPNINIPQKSTAIHGIDNNKVKNAPQLISVFSELKNKLKEKMVIGYNIGFDLAILQAETQRYALDFQTPNALCVRQLASIALGRNTMLIMGTLEALATQFQIPTPNRHTAIGDARITGKLFLALLPMLHEKNISTFGDAQKALQTLDDQRLATIQHGWVDVIKPATEKGKDKQIDENYQQMKRIDPFAYSHKIASIMQEPPLIMPAKTKILEAAKIMKKYKAECIFVGASPENIEGIISEKDIVACMALPLNEVMRARDMPLEKIMSQPVICVQEEDYVHVALGRLDRYDIRHLGVKNDKGDLCGWLSMRDVSRLRLTQAMVIGDELAQAENASDIARALKNLPMLCQSLRAETVPSYEIASVVSGQYRLAMRRAAALAEEMVTKSDGEKPATYCLLILGSGGREESLLAADQDHALIYADVVEEGSGGVDKAAAGASGLDVDKAAGAGGVNKAAAAQKWFQKLGKTIADILNEAGIPYCDGGVMASEERWCKSLSAWEQTIKLWTTRIRVEDVLFVDIFFDFMPVYGDRNLSEKVQNMIWRETKGHPEFLKLLAQNLFGSGGHASGKGFFGGLKTDKGRFNIKFYLLLPLIEVLRILAVSRQIDAKNSAKRAAELCGQGGGGHDRGGQGDGGDGGQDGRGDKGRGGKGSMQKGRGRKNGARGDEQEGLTPEILLLSEDVQFCSKLVLRQQIADIEQGLMPTSKIEMALLSRQDKHMLKTIQGRVDRLHYLLSDCLF